MSFRLTVQILFDAAEKCYSGRVRLTGPDHVSLEDVRLYHAGTILQPRFIYALTAKEATADFPFRKDVALILCGQEPAPAVPEECTVLTIEANVPLAEVFTLMQDTFEQYRIWDRKLNEACLSNHPLDVMLEASLPILGNPLFIHDQDFCVMSCPRHIPGMLIWTRDARTGWNLVPLSLIQDFKTDPEYIRTLNTHGACLYSKEQRGYPILYVNLWKGRQYLGRICVDELENPIEPGHYTVLTYLGQMIEQMLQNQTMFQLNYRNEMISFFIDYLEGRTQEAPLITQTISYLNWKPDDRYLCLRLEGLRQNIQRLSSAATLNAINTVIPSGYAFLHQNGISVIVNLSYSHTRPSDVISSLAVLLREGLLKMGVSSELRNFLQFPQGYTQAKAALEIGRQSESMTWCYRFDDYCLDFLLRQGTAVLAPELLCSEKLILLKDYDVKNDTELYRTLRIFLENERNVMQTARDLFIHRSTLLYRLKRIRKLTDVNLDDEKERLVLRISYYILEGKGASL
ncbi:MAG: helix-turn-helix domain-containing protein [Lachnospiraceae bacterium]|nr:helix-turn-helix domain-containing protein [Lachnospiraceae bacterium]